MPKPKRSSSGGGLSREEVAREAQRELMGTISDARQVRREVQPLVDELRKMRAAHVRIIEEVNKSTDRHIAELTEMMTAKVEAVHGHFRKLNARLDELTDTRRYRIKVLELDEEEKNAPNEVIVPGIRAKSKAGVRNSPDLRGRRPPEASELTEATCADCNEKIWVRTPHLEKAERARPGLRAVLKILCVPCYRLSVERTSEDPNTRILHD